MRLGMKLLLAVGLTCISAFFQETRPVRENVPPQVRYSGSDGVELQYPTTWWRGLPQVREPLTQPLLTLLRTDPDGKSALTFAYHHLDLEDAPEAERNAAGLARATIVAARQEDPKRVVQDLTPMKVGGVDGFYFALLRPLPDGRIRLARQWAVTWNGTLFLFSGAAAPEDQESHREIDEVMATVSFSPDYRKENGEWVAFHDRFARVSLEIPAHWHDERTARAFVAEWGPYTPDGERQAIIRLLANRITDPEATPETFLQTFAEEFTRTLGKPALQSDAAIEIGEFAGRRQILRSQDAKGTVRWLHFCVVRREDRFIIVIAIVLDEINATFKEQWDKLLASIRTH